MKPLILVILLAVLAWQGNARYKARIAHDAAVEALETELPSVPSTSPRSVKVTPPDPSGAFRCDGRKYCSQMTSCAEATFFLRNCSGVKMDGNNDGVPCEQQWCNR
jgi:hypothetical protein